MTELGNEFGTDPGPRPGQSDETVWPFAVARSGIDSSSSLFRPGPPAGSNGSSFPRNSTWPPPDQRGEPDHLVELDAEPSRVSGGGWLQGVAVLVAVFLAVTAGMAALWNTSSSTLEAGDVAVDGIAPPSLPEEAFPSVLPTTSEVTDPSVVPPATVTQPAAWVTIDDPALAFVVALPNEPDITSAGSGRRVSSSGPFGSSLVIVEQPFAAASAGFNDLGLIAGATEAVGGQPHEGEFTDLIGGNRIYDFTASLGDVAVRGRVLIVNDQRFVLVQEVPASAVAEPDVLATYDQLVEGFRPR